MQESYEFTDETYAALEAAGVAWQDVLFVLYTSAPKFRRHAHYWLNIVARDRAGQWLMVAGVERRNADDIYTVVGARYLDPEESGKAKAMLEGRDG